MSDNSPRGGWIAGGVVVLCLVAAAMWRKQDPARPAVPPRAPHGRVVSDSTLASVLDRVSTEPERATEILVQFVASSPTGITGAQFDLIRDRLLETGQLDRVLREGDQVVLPGETTVRAWLESMREWDEGIWRGVDVDVGEDAWVPDNP